jgi:hypothetical protein
MSRLTPLHLAAMLALAGTGRAVLVSGKERPEPETAPEPTQRAPLDYPYHSAFTNPARPAPTFDTSRDGWGKRQGERIARGKFDFSASERCIERIKEREAKKAAPGVCPLKESDHG